MRMKGSNAGQRNVGLLQNGIVLLNESKKQCAGCRMSEKCAIVGPGRRGQWTDGCVVHELGVLVGQNFRDARQSIAMTPGEGCQERFDVMTRTALPPTDVEPAVARNPGTRFM